MAKTAGVINKPSRDLLAGPIDLKQVDFHWREPLTAEREDAPVARRVPKYRSDLAYGAGLLAITFLISHTALVYLIFVLKHADLISDTVFFLSLPLPRLPAPFALWLGIAAWAELKRDHTRSGKLPATLGLVVGFLGTLILLFETYEVIRVLAR
jgi:hypothetical protein